MRLIYAIKTMNNSYGGAERVLADVTAGLCDNGHDVSLITFDEPNGESFYPLHRNVKRFDLGIGRTERKSGLTETISRMMKIRQIVKAEKPDAAVAFMHSMFIPMALALAGTGIPVIASEHIVPDHYKTRKLEFALFAFSSLFVRRITVISEKIRKTYPPYLQQRMDIIPNPVGKPETDRNGLAHNAKTRNIILNVGRLDPQKDQETLIRAFSRIADDHPDWHLRIIGEGPLRPQLEALITALGLDGRVSLPGISKQIHDEYSAASIFVMPSRYEAFGLATVEAMSHGLPVIGFADCPGTNEVIEDGFNGYLVGADDRIEGLSEAMRELIVSESVRQRIGQNGKLTHQKFAPDKIVQRWEKLLDHVRSSPANANDSVEKDKETSNPYEKVF